MYMKISPIDSIKKGNFVSKDGKIFIERNMFDLEKIKSNYENVIERNLISGIAIIKKKKTYIVLQRILEEMVQLSVNR